MKKNNVEDIIRSVVSPLIEPSGYELVDVEHKKEGANWVLRLFIDHEDGIDLDDCQWVSNTISDKLDEADPIPHAYFLEVSSPGIERPLKNPKDFDRFKGHNVLIKSFAPIDGKKEFLGELVGLKDDNAVIIQGDVEINIPLNQIAKARLVVDF